MEENFFPHLQILFYHFPGQNEESHEENYRSSLYDP